MEIGKEAGSTGATVVVEGRLGSAGNTVSAETEEAEAKSQQTRLSKVSFIARGSLKFAKREGFCKEYYKGSPEGAHLRNVQTFQGGPTFPCFARCSRPTLPGAFFSLQNTAAERRGYNLQLSEMRPSPSPFQEIWDGF